MAKSVCTNKRIVPLNSSKCIMVHSQINQVLFISSECVSDVTLTVEVASAEMFCIICAD